MGVKDERLPDNFDAKDITKMNNRTAVGDLLKMSKEVNVVDKQHGKGRGDTPIPQHSSPIVHPEAKTYDRRPETYTKKHDKQIIDKVGQQAHGSDVYDANLRHNREEQNRRRLQTNIGSADILAMEKNDFDRLIIANHAFMLTQGFRLVATGKVSDELNEIIVDAPEVGLEGWQGLDDAYAFSYVKTEGKKQRVQITGIVMDKTLVVHYLSPDADFRPATAELPLSEFAKGSQEGTSGLTNVDKFLQRLDAALVTALHENEGARLDTKTEVPSSITTETRNQEGRPRPEETEALRDLREMPPTGGDDLNPPGIPRFFPGRPGIIGDPDDPGLGGGGMHVGPSHPMFRRRFPGDVPEGPMPGIRYDPIGPEGVPGFNARDFQRGARRGHPDLERPGRGFGDPDIGPGFGGGGGFPF